DGIRDATVTGVQTCALPISIPAQPHALRVPDVRRAAQAVEEDERQAVADDLISDVGAVDGGQHGVVLSVMKVRCRWPPRPRVQGDRKSTRLNSSHGSISYAV